MQFLHQEQNKVVSAYVIQVAERIEEDAHQIKWKTIIEVARIIVNDATVTQAECTAAVEAAKAVCCLARTGSMCFDLDGKLIDDYKNCKDNTSKDPFSRSEICTNVGYSLS